MRDKGYLTLCSDSVMLTADYRKSAIFASDAPSPQSGDTTHLPTTASAPGASAQRSQGAGKAGKFCQPSRLYTLDHELELK